MNWDSLRMHPVIRDADPPSIADLMLVGLGWSLVLVAILGGVWLVKQSRGF